MDDTLALIAMEDDVSMMEIERVGDDGVGLTLYMDGEGEIHCIYIPIAKLPQGDRRTPKGRRVSTVMSTTVRTAPADAPDEIILDVSPPPGFAFDVDTVLDLVGLSVAYKAFYDPNGAMEKAPEAIDAYKYGMTLQVRRADAKRLSAILGRMAGRVHGDDVAALRAVSDLLRIKIKRQVSPEVAARLAAMSREHGFKAISERHFPTQGSTPTLEDDSR